MVLTFFPPTKMEPRVTLQRLYLRPPRRGDWSEWAKLRNESRDFLVPWEPKWADDALTRAAFRRRLTYYANNWSRDQGYAFFIFRRVNDELIGGITLANVRRSVAQNGSLGDWLGRRHVRLGYMTEAVGGTCSFAFDTLGLHRIEAACLPENTASQGVLRNAGFRQEGLARRYLKINGSWQDHLLYAILREDYRAAAGR